MKKAWVIIFASSLLGCSSMQLQTVTPLSPTPSITTIALTEDPSSTQGEASATPSPLISSPSPTSAGNYMTAPIREMFPFKPTREADCPLPCWQDLTIGQSSEEDIYRTFRQLLGFTQSFDFDKVALDKDTIERNNLDIRNTNVIGYSWFDENPNGYFEIFAISEETTHKLVGLQFQLGAYSFYEILTPSQLVREVGAPSQFLLQIQFRGTDYNITGVILYASKGISYFFIDRLIGIATDNLDYCLSSVPLSAEVYITEPFDLFSTTSLTEIQKRWILLNIPNEAADIEETFFITPEELYQRTISNDDELCFQISK